MTLLYSYSEKGHQSTQDAPEHSVEVELPWLQKVLGNFEVVPIVMGDQSYESSRALGVALTRTGRTSDRSAAAAHTTVGTGG